MNIRWEKVANGEEKVGAIVFEAPTMIPELDAVAVLLRAQFPALPTWVQPFGFGEMGFGGVLDANYVNPDVARISAVIPSVEAEQGVCTNCEGIERGETCGSCNGTGKYFTTDKRAAFNLVASLAVLIPSLPAAEADPLGFISFTPPYTGVQGFMRIRFSEDFLGCVSGPKSRLAGLGRSMRNQAGALLWPVSDPLRGLYPKVSESWHRLPLISLGGKAHAELGPMRSGSSSEIASDGVRDPASMLYLLAGLAMLSSEFLEQSAS